MSHSWSADCLTSWPFVELGSESDYRVRRSFSGPAVTGLHRDSEYVQCSERPTSQRGLPRPIFVLEVVRVGARKRDRDRLLEWRMSSRRQPCVSLVSSDVSEEYLRPARLAALRILPIGFVTALSSESVYLGCRRVLRGTLRVSTRLLLLPDTWTII